MPLCTVQRQMAILKNHAKYWGGWLAYFGHYLPWGVHRQNGGTRDNYPSYSGQILDLKEAKAAAINTFKAQIEPELPDGIAVAVVPGHDPAKPGKGLPALAACIVRSLRASSLAASQSDCANP
jgi:hypothetical protein